MMTSRIARATLALSLAGTIGILGGCSGGGSSGAVATSGAAGPAPAEVGVARGAAGDKAESSSVAVDAQKLARTATLSLQVDDVGKATAQVRAINVAAAGYVLSENIGTTGTETDERAGISPTTYAALVISVPTDKLDATLDELQRIGTVLDRRSQTENVTGEYVDVQARVVTMKKSVARIQDLIDKTDDIDQLVKLERELSSRQAELEAIEARLQELDRSTSRSPITINLTTDPSLIDSALSNPATGFTGGLKAGWKAFVGSLAALFTIVGAVLPFALLGAVLAVPIVYIRRRLQARRAARPPKVNQRNTSAPLPDPMAGVAHPAPTPAPAPAHAPTPAPRPGAEG
ncbi:MAG: DUF4349 domain-containing protein [Dermatophilaceae bacterium]